MPLKLSLAIANDLNVNDNPATTTILLGTTTAFSQLFVFPKSIVVNPIAPNVESIYPLVLILRTIIS